MGNMMKIMHTVSNFLNSMNFAYQKENSNYGTPNIPDSVLAVASNMVKRRDYIITDKDKPITLEKCQIYKGYDYRIYIASASNISSYIFDIIPVTDFIDNGVNTCKEEFYTGYFVIVPSFIFTSDNIKDISNILFDMYYQIFSKDANNHNEIPKHANHSLYSNMMYIFLLWCIDNNIGNWYSDGNGTYLPLSTIFKYLYPHVNTENIDKYEEILNGYRFNNNIISDLANGKFALKIVNTLNKE